MPSTRFTRMGACLGLATLAAFTTAAAQEPLGFTLGPDNTVLLKGKPFRGIGMQYQSCFQRRLLDPEDTTYRKGFEELASYGIPFVRFMAFGFWPNEMKLYFDDKEAYWAIMDDVVATAERTSVGLIPSPFWWLACVPDLVGEPVNQWGNPQSKTHEFMRQYTRELVTRYKDSPAIYGWEFGNEYNLAMDLPNAMDNLPWAIPERGTPATRSEKDVLSSEDVVTALKAFAEEVRKHDPNRLIFSGHAISRPSEYHQRLDGSWTRDTPEEYIQQTIHVNPDPIDTITIHLYPHALKEGYFSRDDVTYEDLLKATMEASEKAGKPLFVGEFGAPDNEESGGREEARKQNERLFAALETMKVPLACYWVYDFSHQDDFINVTSTNHRSYVLDMLKEANQKLREEMGTVEQSQEE